MTKQCLEIIFSGFVVVTRRLLEDHLKGGVLADKAEDDEFRAETKSVKKANTRAERDFGMLDYQIKLKPKAIDFAIEGVLMFKLDNTDQWRDKLTEEKRKLFLDAARQSKKLQREKYIRTKREVSQKRAQNGRRLRREIKKGTAGKGEEGTADRGN